MKAIARSDASATRVWYRGNNDASTLGGAPNIARLFVQGAWQDIAGGRYSANFFLRPNAVTDNFDGLRYARVKIYDWSGTSGMVLLYTNYLTFPDRMYKVPATDSDTSNAVATSFNFNLNTGTVNGNTSMLAGTGHNICFLVTLYNAVGPSNEKWFVRSTTLNSDWTQQSTDPYNGATSGTDGGGGTDGNGGGGAGGGGCPAPWVLIKCFDFTTGKTTTKTAGTLVVGDLVWTKPDGGEGYSYYPVSAVSHEKNICSRVSIHDGRMLEVSSKHRFSVDGAWVQTQLLKKGDIITGDRPGIVESVEPVGECDVVRITVETASTYQTEGLLSHNMKPIVDY
jgi:hypothetical protein